MALNLWDPMSMLAPFGRGMRDPMESLFQFPQLSQAAPPVSMHPTDIIEMPDSYKVVVDAPGMSADDLSITLSDGVLTISGKKKTEHRTEDREGRVLRRERAFTSFTRSFSLPGEGAVNEDEVQASLANGVLEVVVPKTAPPPKPEPRRIKVQHAEPPPHEGAAPVHRVRHGHGHHAAEGEGAGAGEGDAAHKVTGSQ